MTVSDLTIDGANKIGLRNVGMLAGENFNITMTGPGPAVKQDGKQFALLGAELTGIEGLAIEGTKDLYLRDVKANGYSGVIEEGKPAVDELVSGSTAGLFVKREGSLKLEHPPTPIVPYETDMSKWANVLDYGAEHALGGEDGKHDSTEAFEKALADKTKTHIMVPYGGKPWKHSTYEYHKVPDPRGRLFWIRKSLVIPPHVNRIVGVQGMIHHDYADQVRFIVEGDSDVPLTIEGMNAPPLIIKGKRTVVLSHSSFDVNWQDIPRDKRGYDLPPYIVREGTGDVFMNDVSSPLQIENPEQKVWIRFYNDERSDWFKKPTIDVYAGQLWILGWKSEGFLTRIMIESGTCEMVGYNSYSQSKKWEGEPPPIFDIRGGDFAAIHIAQDGIKKYQVLVTETRNGQTKTFNWKTDNDGNDDLSLYTGHEPTHE